MDATLLYQQLQDIQAQHIGPYERLNTWRDWINKHLPDFELYLEDVWNDHAPGETWFEYILRSRKTLNETPMLGYDRYRNHQDAGGVWHLGEYIDTMVLIPNARPLVDFIMTNQSLH